MTCRRRRRIDVSVDGVVAEENMDDPNLRRAGIGGVDFIGRQKYTLQSHQPVAEELMGTVTDNPMSGETSGNILCDQLAI